MKPYYADDTVTLYCGDMREVLPPLDVEPDCIVTDPPYGAMQRNGSCVWDVWPEGWPPIAAAVTRSMWCFGLTRTLMARHQEIEAAGWHMSHDVIWSKGHGTGVVADRFRPSHELAVHWYQGKWRDVRHETPRVSSDRPSAPPRHHRPSESVRTHTYTWRPVGEWTDDGLRYPLSVLPAPLVVGGHPTEKPVSVLDLLIRYACPPGGLVLDPFAGSGSTAAAARLSGRRAVLIEADERYCEAITRRLAQDVLPLGGVL